jgi:hypothetical protein
VQQMPGSGLRMETNNQGSSLRLLTAGIKFL